MAIYELYVSKLNPLRPDLFQRPKKFVRGDESEWYDNQVIGRDPLNNIMKDISIDAQLSKVYTNHSIRATCLTQLDQAGFEVRHIQAVSGHKSEESIKSYSKRCPDKKKREMAQALDLALAGPKKKKSPTATVSKNPEDIVDFVPIENNKDDFDIGEIINEVSKEDILKTLEQIEKENEEKSEAEANIQQNIPQGQPNASTENTTNRKENEVAAPVTPQANVEKDTENAVVPSQQNVINHVTNQSLPFLPNMVFNNSSVTINYSFHTHK